MTKASISNAKYIVLYSFFLLSRAYHLRGDFKTVSALRYHMGGFTGRGIKLLLLFVPSNATTRTQGIGTDVAPSGNLPLCHFDGVNSALQRMKKTGFPSQSPFTSKYRHADHPASWRHQNTSPTQNVRYGHNIPSVQIANNVPVGFVADVELVGSDDVLLGFPH